MSGMYTKNLRIMEADEEAAEVQGRGTHVRRTGVMIEGLE